MRLSADSHPERKERSTKKTPTHSRTHKLEYKSNTDTDRSAWRRSCPPRDWRSSTAHPAGRRSRSARPPRRIPTSDPVCYVTTPPGTVFSRTPPPFRACATATKIVFRLFIIQYYNYASNTFLCMREHTRNLANFKWNSVGVGIFSLHIINVWILCSDGWGDIINKKMMSRWVCNICI